MGRWHEALQAFEESVRYKDNVSHTPLARFKIAECLRKLDRQREAIPILMQLTESSPDKEIIDDSIYWLAQCLVDIQAWNDAKTAMRSLLKRFPESPLANEIKLQLADISLHH